MSRKVYIYSRAAGEESSSRKEHNDSVHALCVNIQTSNCAGGSALGAAGQMEVWMARVLAGITGGENDHGDDGNTGAEGELGVCLYWKRKGENTYRPELLHC